MGVKADPSVDEIRVDGRRLRAPAGQRYILLNKPAGVVTTRSDPQRRQTVLDLLDGVRDYVYPVGRLDYDSEGLLLLTNDGDLAARLTHPRHEVERTYEAYVTGTPDKDAIEQLRRGIPLDGKRTMPADVRLISRASPPRKATPERGSAPRKGVPLARRANGVLLITIREGRNRQVRRMCEAVGHPVRKLRRVRIGPISDPHLRPGQWRELTSAEVEKLKSGKVEK
jgi:pseudouridine synthase